MNTLTFIPKYHQQIQEGTHKGTWVAILTGSTRIPNLTSVAERVAEAQRIVTEGGSLLTMSFD